jgi:hypothetical protein
MQTSLSPHSGALRWILEYDNPSARYLGLINLLDTTWPLLFLAQLGVFPTLAIRNACDFVLDHSRRVGCRPGQPVDGRFIAGLAPGSALNCLNGNLLYALEHLGYRNDPRFIQAREGLLRHLDRWGFKCPRNNELDCWWGAVKVLRAFLDGQIESQPDPLIQAVVTRGVQLIKAIPLLGAPYPACTGDDGGRLRLGFPLDHKADVLETLTVLVLAGEESEPVVEEGIQWLLSRRDAQGRWHLESTPDRIWASFGQTGQPNKWVTQRALRLLKLATSPYWTQITLEPAQ